MRLEALDMKVEVWDNTVLKLDPHHLGLKGSPTTVKRIFSPEREKGEILGDGVHDPLGTVELLINKLIQRELLVL